ncbi:hypothetical protein AC482_06665 [miscellaneous Crenarchaeota group-15 archaeon DG-45]|uniref:Uncharacterized protein n=1 Tax=miscellaneous Crenarchaeota group-15 archaeon DG-45 TaxID=1685127 RepID=A0A0M0BLF2_9ARCH|nr:MAG: hypothetical protein AC482_06665 [miscellaneous Crenarchaeota group-15 archaeon DG-45]
MDDDGDDTIQKLVEHMFNESNLFTSSSLKLLYVLALDPMRSFSPREAIRAVRVGARRDDKKASMA